MSVLGEVRCKRTISEDWGDGAGGCVAEEIQGSDISVSKVLQVNFLKDID